MSFPLRCASLRISLTEGRNDAVWIVYLSERAVCNTEPGLSDRPPHYNNTDLHHQKIPAEMSWVALLEETHPVLSAFVTEYFMVGHINYESRNGVNYRENLEMVLLRQVRLLISEFKSLIVITVVLLLG